jgi:PAT family beta-lactamase induction signal transducer AmpG
MATLINHPRLRLAFLCLMYLAQGLPFGFVTVALAAYLAAHGATTGEIGGVVAMAVLPWSFKWAWGPLVDSGRLAALGRRRPWIMVAQVLMIATAVPLAWVPAGRTAWLGWLVCLHNVFVGLQDVAVDALAVDMLEGRDRERASGMMYGSSILGTFLGGAGLGIVTARLGLGVAIGTMVAAQVLFLAVVVLVRERPGDAWLRGRIMAEATPHAARPGIGSMARALARAMTRPAAVRAAAGAFAMKVLPQTLAVLMTVHLIDVRGWTQERYAAVTGGGGILLGFFASIAGGFVASRLGPRRTALAANALLGCVWITFAMLAPQWDRTDVVFGWVAMDTICQAVATVALFAIFMRVASPAVAATQFTASMALMNLATTAGSWLAGPVGAALDTPTVFLIAGFLQPLAGLLLPAEGDEAARRETRS